MEGDDPAWYDRTSPTAKGCTTSTMTDTDTSRRSITTTVRGRAVRHRPRLSSIQEMSFHDDDDQGADHDWKEEKRVEEMYADADEEQGWGRQGGGKTGEGEEGREVGPARDTDPASMDDTSSDDDDDYNDAAAMLLIGPTVTPGNFVEVDDSDVLDGEGDEPLVIALPGWLTRLVPGVVVADVMLWTFVVMVSGAVVFNVYYAVFEILAPLEYREKAAMARGEGWVSGHLGHIAHFLKSLSGSDRL